MCTCLSWLVEYFNQKYPILFLGAHHLQYLIHKLWKPKLNFWIENFLYYYFNFVTLFGKAQRVRNLNIYSYIDLVQSHTFWKFPSLDVLNSNYLNCFHYQYFSTWCLLEYSKTLICPFTLCVFKWIRHISKSQWMGMILRFVNLHFTIMAIVWMASHVIKVL